MEIVLAAVVLIVAVVFGRKQAKRIYYIGNLAGNFIRFKPNFGFRIGPLRWSRLYGRSR